MALTHKTVPDREFYITDFARGDAPRFSPWELHGEFGANFRSSGAHRGRRIVCYYLYEFALRALSAQSGEIWEAGVYRGETAVFLAKIAAQYDVPLRLFDTFDGMPETDPQRDFHRAGDFDDTSLELVKARIEQTGNSAVDFRPGLVPATFAGLENSRIALAHIDLDIYAPIKASCEFVYPRLTRGGAIVFDDYAWLSCPGARAAVDEFFADKPERPIVLPTGQAFVLRL